MQDVARGLRDHYNGTIHDAYQNQNPEEPWRPISVLRASISHITQVRPQLAWPAEIANIQYIALGMTALSAYVPFYQGLETVPAAYQGATNTADDNSLFWMYRKLQALVMQNYPVLAPPVQKAIATFEAENTLYQEQLEQEYLNTWGHDLPAAKQLIKAFTENTVVRHKKMLQSQIRLTLATLKWQPLSNSEYTALINQVEKKYHFGGR